MEAAIGFEPMNEGFADLCLSHLATPPWKTIKAKRKKSLDRSDTCGILMENRIYVKPNELRFSACFRFLLLTSINIFRGFCR
jgi:hypothetical protein